MRIERVGDKARYNRRETNLVMTTTKNSQRVDFKKVKESVTIQQALEHYGVFDALNIQGDRASGACPIHDGKNKTQFRANLTKNIWRCFGNCDGGGNVLDFVMAMEDTGVREAGLLMVEWFDIADAVSLSDTKRHVRQTGKRTVTAKENNSKQTQKKDKADTPTENPVLGFKLKVDTEHPYFEERGITPGSIEKFGLGYCDKGTMAGRIVIPLHNIGGELIGYAGRWPGDPPDENTPKYLLPKKFHKSLELFNQHRVLDERKDEPLIVVEGFFDVIRLDQLGVHSAVALMGKTLSAQQEQTITRLLSAHDDRIQIVLDGDEAGANARGEIAQRLSQYAFVRTVVLPEDTQPEQATGEEDWLW